MIELNGRVYPMSRAHCPDRVNHLIYSPWTGQTWARLDFGFGQWVAFAYPAAGERSFLGDSHVPGSLFTNYDKWIVDHLPLDLIDREISFLVNLRSGPISWYNCPTNGEELKPMSPKLMDDIAEMRTKILNKVPLTDEELRNALKAMRADRAVAARNSDAKKAAAAPIDPDKALDAIFG